jgi:outer membrane protein assembly factor BamB
MWGPRSWGAVLSALVLMVVLAGCWPVVGQGPDRAAYNSLESGITPATVNQLTVAWSRNLAGGAVNGLVASPSNAVLTEGSRVRALDLASGQVRWTDDAGSQPPWLNPGVDNGEVTAVQGVTGMQGGVGASTTRFDEVTGARLGTSSNRIEARRGSRTLGENTTIDPNGDATQYFVVEDANDPGATWGGAYAIGFRVPFAPLTLGAQRVYSAGFGLVPGGGGTAQGNGIRALISTPGFCGPFACPIWSLATDGTGATPPVLTPDESTVFTATNAGTVYAVDAATGALRWTAAVGSPVDQLPALANGLLYVAPRNGQVLAFAAGGCSAATCAPQFQLDTGGPVSTQPAVAGGLVFAGTSDGSVLAFVAAGCGAATCAPVWSHELGFPISAGPIVAYGNVLVGTLDSRVVDFRLAPA